MLFQQVTDLKESPILNTTRTARQTVPLLRTLQLHARRSSRAKKPTTDYTDNTDENMICQTQTFHIRVIREIRGFVPYILDANRDCGAQYVSCQA